MYSEIVMHDRKIKYIIFRHTQNNKHHQKVKLKFFYFLLLLEKRISLLCVYLSTMHL